MREPPPGAPAPSRKTTGIPAVAALSRRRVSVVGPSMPGIITSSRIRSGDQAAASASPSRPHAQVRTVSSGSRDSASSTTLRTSASSSTTRNRCRSHATPPHVLGAWRRLRPRARDSTRTRFSIEVCQHSRPMPPVLAPPAPGRRLAPNQMTHLLAGPPCRRPCVDPARYPCPSCRRSPGRRGSQGRNRLRPARRAPHRASCTHTTFSSAWQSRASCGEHFRIVVEMQDTRRAHRAGAQRLVDAPAQLLGAERILDPVEHVERRGDRVCCGPRRRVAQHDERRRAVSGNWCSFRSARCRRPRRAAGRSARAVAVALARAIALLRIATSRPGSRHDGAIPPTIPIVPWYQRTAGSTPPQRAPRRTQAGLRKTLVPPPCASAKPTSPPIRWIYPSSDMLRPSPVPPLTRASELSAWANFSNIRPLNGGNARSLVSHPDAHLAVALVR